MLKRGAASAQDPGARGAEPGPRSGSRTRGVGGARSAGAEWGRGARGPREGGAAARGGRWRPECHTRGGSGGGDSGSSRRRRDGHGRAGSGGRRLPPPSLVACSLARSPARLLAGRVPSSLQRSREGRSGGPRTPTSSSSTGNPGQGGGCGSDGAGARSVAERTARASEEGGARAFSYLWGRGRIP